MQSRWVPGAIVLAGALVLPAVPAAATPSVADRPGTGSSWTAQVPAPEPPAAAPAARRKDPATLSVTSSAAQDGQVTLTATSDAATLQVRYRDADDVKRTASEKITDGQAQLSLPAGSSSIRVRAKGTSKLTASPWAAVPSSAPEQLTSPGATYWVSPSSRILGKLGGYKSVNRYTRDYYMIRSYMQKFEAAGGGTLVLAPGRYDISSTIYVPSNTTIRLSEGTTLVKSGKTGTKKFSASNSMFMLIRPSLGKKKGAVGGHDGASGITIAGAGAGRSVIDLANVHDSLAIISGHNRDVTISGITFRNMNNNHFIEMDACADCEISGNEFLDAAPGTRETAEAINLDTPDPRTHGFGSIWSKQDGTPNERVTISGNRFDGLERALGTHNFTANAYHTDIVVTGNTITSNSDDAIHIMNWANPVFTANTITSSADSMGIRACGTTNPTIIGNTFDGSAAAVAFRSCSGENGTTKANQVTDDNVADMGTNLMRPGLGSSEVSVPGQDQVTLEATTSPAGAPSQPLMESVVAGDRQVSVRWTPAVADDGAPITAYRVVVRGTPDGDAIQTVDAPPDATEAVVTGLENGTTVYVTVAAVNSVGESPTGGWDTSEVTPLGPPSPPVGALSSSLTIGTVGVSWQPPASDGGQPITGYRAHIYSDPEAREELPGSPVELDVDTAQHEWAGLTEGVTYYVRVAAVNSLGEGAATEPVAVVVKPTPAMVAPVL